jgi:hypothetical protein
LLLFSPRIQRQETLVFSARLELAEADKITQESQ